MNFFIKLWGFGILGGCLLYVTGLTYDSLVQKRAAKESARQVVCFTGSVKEEPKAVDPTDDIDKLDEEMRRRVQFGEVVEDSVCYKNRRGYSASNISKYEFQEIVLSGNRLEKNSNGSFNMFGPQGDCECSLRLTGFRKLSAEKKCYPSATYF
jgi:hypothetical protein